jgi:hypothetical protein
MPVYFSNAMAQSSESTSIWSPSTNPLVYNASYKRPGWATHARLRKKKMGFLPQAFTTGTSDQVVLGTFKSSDRIWDIRYTQNGTLSAGAFNLGFFRAQVDHIPVATADSSATALATAQSATAAQSRTDMMLGIGANGQFRGLAIWQILDLGTPTIIRDPQVDYDLVMTISTTWATVAPTICFFEADYVSFG